MWRYTQAVIKTNQKALSENLSELRYKNVCTQLNSWGTQSQWNRVHRYKMAWHDNAYAVVNDIAYT